jgi:hypothetical protein
MPIDWYVESFRLTFFVGAEWTQRPLFAELTGIEPTERSEKTIPIPTRQESGGFGEVHVRTIQQPGRLDILMTDVPTRNVSDPEAPDYKAFFWIAKLVSAFAMFDEITAKVPHFTSPLLRIAYVPTLICRASDARGTMQLLRQALPLVQFDPEIDTDLFWQINRPRSVDGIGKINRVSKWNALQTHLVPVPISGVAGQQAAILAIPPLAEFAVRAEFDVNTAPTNPEISPDAVKNIINVLRSFAIEIAEYGDQP